jgi:hypothetical protein
MGKYEKLILKILSGQSDTNIPFGDLCNLLQGTGFVMRIRGSHHVFRKEGVEEKINLQREGGSRREDQSTT